MPKIKMNKKIFRDIRHRAYQACCSTRTLEGDTIDVGESISIPIITGGEGAKRESLWEVEIKHIKQGWRYKEAKPCKK